MPKALHIVDTQHKKETHTKSDFASYVKMNPKPIYITAFFCFWDNTKEKGLWFYKSSFDLSW